MATVLADIKTTNWQISIRGAGYIEEGLADIRQCLDIILRTQKGTDNLRPEFGSDIYQYTDYPVTDAIPNMKRAIIEAVSIWEKRIELVSISHTTKEYNIIFDITYKLVDQDIIDSFSYTPNGNNNPTDGLILQAFYPFNPYGRRYKMFLELDGNNALPTQPANGFATLNELFAWVNENWGFYGTWQQLIDRIILYAKNDYSTGSIGIELLTGSILLEAPIPVLTYGQYYNVAFTANGEDGSPPLDAQLNNMEDLLTWINSNWDLYGNWQILPGNIDLFGDFNGDFNGDFGGQTILYYLVLSSTTLSSGTLNITIGG